MTSQVQLILIDHVRPATESERTGVIELPGRAMTITEVGPRVDGVKVTKTFEILTLHTYPTGPEIAEYTNPLIRCGDCGAEFPVDDLEYDELEDYAHCDTVCPQCHSWHCCVIKYETIPEYRERTKHGREGNSA